MGISRDDLMRWCWHEAELGGLSSLEPSYLAQRYHVPLMDITRFIPNRTYALRFLIEDVLGGVGLPFSSTPAGNDFLFDGIMACFDKAQPHQAAISKIWSELPWHPLESCALIPEFTKPINKMVDQAFGEMSWFMAQINYKAYQVLVLEVFLVWLDDSTPDLAKTMAKLDQGLKKLDSCRALFSSWA